MVLYSKFLNCLGTRMLLSTAKHGANRLGSVRWSVHLSVLSCLELRKYQSLKGAVGAILCQNEAEV